MTKVSAVLIAKNAFDTLARTLESVAWCDQIVVVVDGSSSDQTEEIARTFTSDVYVQDWLGYGKQKNVAIRKARNEWILSLDADEVVTPELAKEISTVVSHSNVDGYSIRFETYIGEKLFRYGGLQNDWHTRLFRKDKGQFGGVVHEVVEVTNEQKLQGVIIHYSYKDFDHLMEKILTYSKLEAEVFVKEGKVLTLKERLRPVLRFVNVYFRKLGFLDGWVGFRHAYYLGYYVWNRNQQIAKLT